MIRYYPSTSIFLINKLINANSGLPFHVNANFVQPASRELIQNPDNSAWNKWLIGEIPGAFMAAFSSLLESKVEQEDII